MSRSERFISIKLFMLSTKFNSSFRVQEELEALEAILMDDISICYNDK